MADKQSYRPADEEVLDIARDLINDYHSHLAPFRVDFVFAQKPMKSKGESVWGKAQLIGGVNAYLSREDKDTTEAPAYFLITLCEPTWRLLTEKGKRALVDHELCHCWVNEEGKPTMLSHDLEEFHGVIERHGIWRTEIQRMLQAASLNRPSLFDMERIQSLTIEPPLRHIPVTIPAEADSYETVHG